MMDANEAAAVHAVPAFIHDLRIIHCAESLFNSFHFNFVDHSPRICYILCLFVVVDMVFGRRRL